MHHIRTLATLLCTALVLHAGDTSRKMAYSQGIAVYVANLDGSGAKKIADGASPNISPDGTRLAFNTQTEKTPERHIAIADVATGKITLLSGVPGNNSYGPIWSPDGSKLVFSTMVGRNWQLAMIDADGSHYRVFEPKAKIGEGLNSVAWLPDSQSFYAQDMATLYHFALDGTVKEKRSLAKFIPRASFGSVQQFSMASDGHTLLLDADMDENTTRKTWDGPPPAIWTFDFSTEKAVRISPKGYFAWDPAWVSESEILCAVQPEKSREPSIYRLSIDGKKRELVVKNASNPTVSR